MELSEIFTKKNIEILKLLERQNLHIRDIATQLNISPAKVHNSIKIFKKYNLVNQTRHKNRIIISLNKNNPKISAIIDMINDSSSKEKTINIFDSISPLDFRYYSRNSLIFQKLQPYLSESAFIKYAVKVEVALVKILLKKKICSQKHFEEIEKASRMVSADDVYFEEDKIKHNIRALVNSIRNKVSLESKPFVHFTATSFDIINTAEALRYKEFTNNILIPELVDLEKTLIEIALREKDTIQVGRTHGQHAIPITFGFAIAQYVSRLGASILKIKIASNNLRGKISGAVGSYNASYLFFNNPEEFEKNVLKELGILPSPISTQIVAPEFILSYIHSVIESFGILANLADDMRHLQRTEIAEIYEHFETSQVGSSTMPQKRNPVSFENVKSLWKEFMPRIITLYSDQISEHQRDLTNSASMRFIPEILAGFYISAHRLKKTMKTIQVDKKSLEKNFNINKSLIIAEPLYILLASYGHPDAHEYVRKLTLQLEKSKKNIKKILSVDEQIQKYLKNFTEKQKEIINNPSKYTGIASLKTEKICNYWIKTLFK